MEKFTHDILDDVIVVSVNLLRATMKEAEEFKQILLKDINEGYKKIVVDLKRCGFMDSTFLGALVIALKEVSKKGGNLKLAAAHADAQAILEITGTSRIFEQHKSVKEAIRDFPSN